MQCNLENAVAALHSRRLVLVGVVLEGTHLSLQAGYLPLSKFIERHDLGGRPRGFGRLRGGGFCGQRGSIRRRLCRNFEPKGEIDRRVGKASYRGKGDGQLLRPVLKAQSNGKILIADFEPPELMLENDGHLFRIFGQQVVRDHDPGGAGTKAQVKVGTTAQTLPMRTRQRFAHDTENRGLDHLGVVEEVLGHIRRLTSAQGGQRASEGLLLPGAPRTASYSRLLPREEVGRERLCCEVV